MTRLAICFVCLYCRAMMEGLMNSIKKLCNEVETVNGFFLGRQFNC